MSYLFLLCLVATCAVLVEGNAFSAQEFLRAAANGDFETVRKLINPAENFHNWANLSPDISRYLSGNVANLQPGPDTHVYGQAETSFISYTNDNGRETKKSGGFGIINKDGDVSTYKFNPTENNKSNQQ